MDRANIVLQLKTYISSFGSFFPLISNTPNPSLILTCILCNGQINFTKIQNYNKKNYAVCMFDIRAVSADIISTIILIVELYGMREYK